jgi:hypothetical protein
MVTCTCGNEPRYIDAHGKLVCGLCPIKEGVDSIRISQIPGLLRWARHVCDRPDKKVIIEIQRLRELIA